MSKALEIASERYAKGEITKEEFEEMKASLSGQSEKSSPPPQSEIPPQQQYSPPPQPQPINDVSQGEVFDISGVAKGLRWLIKACAVISGLSAFLIIKQSGVQKKFDMVYALENNPFFLSITVIPFLITMALFLFWKKKSTDNLFILRGPQSITPAGAVYWYFVPVAWFWKPYEAMRNLAFGFGIKTENRPVLPIWWGLFWGSAALMLFVAASLPENITTQQQAKFYVNWSIALYVIDAIALMAAWAVVDEVTKAQEKALRQVQEGS